VTVNGFDDSSSSGRQGFFSYSPRRLRVSGGSCTIARQVPRPSHSTRLSSDGFCPVECSPFPPPVFLFPNYISATLTRLKKSPVASPADLHLSAPTLVTFCFLLPVRIKTNYRLIYSAAILLCGVGATPINSPSEYPILFSMFASRREAPGHSPASVDSFRVTGSQIFGSFHSGQSFHSLDFVMTPHVRCCPSSGS